MKKAIIIGLGILALGSAVPAMAHDYRHFDRRGDRIDARLDHEEIRVNNRLDNRGSRINERLDAKGERINDRLDALAAEARADGKNRLAEQLDGQRRSHRSPTGPAR